VKIIARVLEKAKRVPRKWESALKPVQGVLAVNIKNARLPTQKNSTWGQLKPTIAKEQKTKKRKIKYREIPGEKSRMYP